MVYLGTNQKGLTMEELIKDGWTVTVFKNDLGSITAKANKPKRAEVITDDFTVDKVLVRIADKVYRRGQYSKVLPVDVGPLRKSARRSI
jgi:hypothetical protein